MTKHLHRIGATALLAALLAAGLSGCVLVEAGDRAMSNKGHEASAGNTRLDVRSPNRPRITVKQLLGRSAELIEASLGKPDFLRSDGGAEIWQYKNSTCVLNVFLYDDAPSAGGIKRVLHFDARTPDGKTADREACLKAVQR